MKKIVLIILFMLTSLLYSCKKEVTVINKIYNYEIDTTDLENINEFNKLLVMICNNVISSCVGVLANNKESIIKNDVSGSAVLINKSNNTYLAITSRHVILGSNNTPYNDIIIVLDNNIRYQASINYIFDDIDIAILSFESELDLKVATISNDDLCTGSLVISCGSPVVLEEYYNSCNIGFISNCDITRKEQTLGNVDVNNKYFSHNSHINVGDSGGGVFNLKGELIGINTYKLADSTKYIEGMSFAIYINNIDLSKIGINY